MDKFSVVIELEHIAKARAAWDVARKKFNADVELLMGLLLNEAARNYMSAEQVAESSGLTVKRVRILMREHGLNLKTGKTLLARKAAEALESNAALLGIAPHEMDLMSPLAYLPAGKQLRKFLETQAVDLDESEHAVEHAVETRELVAAAIYGDGEHGDWLTTVDGSPNAEAYALADRVLAVLNPEDIA